MEYIIKRTNNDDELMHYGVLGMKWGHRKANPQLSNTKKAYKQAKKEYSKAYNSAYGYSSRHPVGQFVSKKKKAESDKRWADAATAAKKERQAKDAYKAEKAKVKAEKAKQKAEQKDVDKYFDKTKENTRIRRAGYGAKVAGTVMTQIGKNMYNQYKDNSSPGKTAVINGMGYGGKALNNIGDLAIAGSMIKQYSDYKKYW